MISTYQSNLENFYYWTQEKPNEIFLKQPIGDDFIDFTYQEAENHVNKLAAFLQEKVQSEPKHVGIMAKKFSLLDFSRFSHFLSRLYLSSFLCDFNFRTIK